jgi:inorganic pyrophosphatase
MRPYVTRMTAAGVCAAVVMLAGCTVEERPAVPVATAAIAATAMDTTVDLLRAITPRDTAGLVHVVVEIPAGTNAKWEVNKQTGRLAWEQRDGRPRVVAFLPYPGNYGFVPRTLLPKALGGDGDPLDVLVLGPAVPRGSVMAVRLLGVLAMQDGGETDDKLIAITPDGPFGDVISLAELRMRYPGALDVVADWFAHYKGPGVVEIGDFADRAVADSILQTAIAAFVE